MHILSKLIGLSLVAFLTGCGGGGGSPGTTNGGTSVSGTSTIPSTTASSTATAVVATPTLVTGIFNAGGASVTGISVGGGFVARATVKDAAGQPVGSRLVTFTVSGSSIATFSPATALTNALGVAEVSIAPASVSSLGAASISANAVVSGVAVTGQTDFSVQASSLALSPLTVASASLASGGNTSAQVTALISGMAASGVPVNISFSASCGRINNQDTSVGGISVTTNGSGVAAVVYDAIATDGSLCSGVVTLTATSAGTAQKSTTISVASPTANAIGFLSASPAQIFVASTGAVDQAIVSFKVFSSVGTGLAGVPVKFSIVTNPGGVGLGSAGSTTPVVANSVSGGNISIPVFSGTIPGAIKLRAELVSNAAVFAESQNLTVASGPPSQRFMSLSVETFNIEGGTLDGASTQLTVRIADRQGNAVDDGTVINFTAEGGQVARSCPTLRVNGISQCSVTFSSQNPKPPNGRVSVLAYTEGTKDYIDVNGNNAFDPGTDTLINIGDAYRDDNENGVYDSATGEFLIPRGVTGSSCASAGAPFPSRMDSCDASLRTTVRQQAIILFSSSNPELITTSVALGAITFKLRSLQTPLLPLPAGTTFTAEASGGTCAVGSLAGTPVPNISPGTDPSASLATNHSVSLTGCALGDVVTIKVKVPSGLVTSFSIRL